MAATETAAPRRAGFSVPLAFKFFLGSAFLIALAVGAAVVVTYFEGDRIAQRAIDNAMAASSGVQKEVEESRLEQLELTIRLIAADSSTAKYLAQAGGATSNLPGLSETTESDTKSIPDLLRERKNQFNFDLGIVLDPKGMVLGRTDQSEAFQESLADDPFVKPLIEKPEQPEKGYWRNGNKLYQAAIMALVEDQIVVGYLVIAQGVNNDLSRQMAKMSGAEIVYLLPGPDKKPLLAASSLDDAGAAAMLNALATQAPEAAQSIAAGRAVPHLDLDFASQHWSARLTPSEGEGLGNLGAVLALTSADKIAAPSRDILNRIVLYGLLSMLVALLLSYVLAREILRPVRTMALAAEQAAAGNYRTQIGLTGSDELARLSRAFDSLLSDLREKSDIEGYVGNLSRFLPDAPPEAAPAVHTETRTPAPPSAATLSVLGVEFRDLAPAEIGADTALDRFSRAAAVIDAAARANEALLSESAGSRFLLAFGGGTRNACALRALAQIREHAAAQGLAPPAAGIVSGTVVRGGVQSGGRIVDALLGVPLLHLDRLLPEAAAGQTVLTRPAGEEIKAELGAQRLAIATGAVTAKKFYALSDTALRDLPTAPQPAIAAAAAAAATGGGAATVVPGGAPRTTGRSVSRPVALAIGATFGGRYRILSELGSGGMGVVYKAHDLELDDVVALKMLKPNALIDSEHLDRLKSEIKLARKITHPNVLRTFDFGEVDGYPYISMEYVRGLTLRYLLNETQRIPYSAGLRIARQLAAGLAAAHEVGVLHRDIKPENLILEQTGNAKLMDFGIARPIRRHAPGHTQPGTFLGTPNYSPPEQLAGEDVDQRADIFSSGVLMCEMFCGKLPFTGANTMEIYMAQMQQAPIKPSEFWPEIPPALDTVILRCLQRKPADRYASALELGQALSQLRA